MSKFRALTQAEIAHYAAKSNPLYGEPVRFMHDGCAVQIETGRKTSRGSNVIYHPVYWGFIRKTALEIAALTGTRAQFDKKHKSTTGVQQCAAEHQ